MELFVSLVTAIANTLLGLFTYYKNPKSATNRLFVLLTLIISAWAIANYFSLTANTEANTLFWIRAVMFVTAPLGPTIFFLVKAFPRKNIGLPVWFQISVLIYVVLTAILSQTSLMFSQVEIINGNIQPTPGPAILLFAVGFLGGIVSAFALLVYKYKHAVGLEKIQLRYLLTGIITMFMFLTLTNFFFVLVLKSSSFVIFGPAFSLVLIGMISIAIVRHRFLEISFLVARAVAFSLLLVTIIGTLASVLLTLPLFLPSQYHTTATILLAIILAFSFNPIHQLLERLTEKLLHKRSYDPNSLLEQLSEDLRSSISLNMLTSKVMRRLYDTIHPTKAAFIVIGDKDQISVKNFDFNPVPELTIKQIKYIARHAGADIMVYEESNKHKVRELLRENDISIAIPLRANNVLHGLFVLGSKASGEVYNSQDLHLLELFGPQLSVGIQNTLAYDEIKSFNVTLRQKIKDATADLRKANKHLRELDKLKDEFVYIATHELKTPVTVIRGYASMIDEGHYGDTPKQLKEPLKEIQSATQQLQLLVNDLLDIARSESTSLNVKTQPTNLNTVIKEAVNNISALAEEKGLKINYADTGSVMVQGDANRLKEVVNNLISNAIKYSDSGTIDISHTSDKEHIVTHIKDQGYGISPENQKKIFSRFFRAEEVSHKAPGTGLGLFIVKQLVEKMGGRIWFSSKLESGSTFSFSLPKVAVGS